MNLLMVSGDRALASGTRGSFYATLEELQKYFERIDVICPHGRRGRGNTSVFPNVFLHSSPYRLWYQPLWIFRKGKELSGQHQYNVMTVHDYPPFYNGLGVWMLARATHVPWVAEIHHIVGYPHAASVQERIGKMSYLPYLKTIGQSTVAFRVVNASVRECLAQWGVMQGKIHIVPSFYLDHELLQSDPSIEKKYDVVFCGRLVANKGLEELLEAIARMTQLPRLLVIGDGPLRPHLEAKNYSIKANATFAGWLLSSYEVYHAMQSGKVFVMCAKSEGGPRVLLEAMALGLPIIATNVGVVPDVIRDGDNGLITSGTPEDLAEKIHRLLSDEALRIRMGAEARKILDRFERKDLITRYADFLKSFA